MNPNYRAVAGRDRGGADATRQVLHVAGVGDVLIRRPQPSDGTWLGLIRRTQDWTSTERWGWAAQGTDDPVVRAVQAGQIPPVIDGCMALFEGQSSMPGLRGEGSARAIGLAFLTPLGEPETAAGVPLNLQSTVPPPGLGALGLVPPVCGAVRLVVDVAGPYRGLGIGTELARRLIRSALDAGTERIEINTSRLNRSLIAFGERLGFDADLDRGERRRLRLAIGAGSGRAPGARGAGHEVRI